MGVFLRVSPFASRVMMDRDALPDADRSRLGRFFGKRGGAVVDANMAVIEAAYDGLIDVTAALSGRMAPEGAGSSAPAGELEEVLR